MDMRALEAKHYALFGAFLVAVGTEVGALQHGWHDAISTGFVGGLIAQLGLMLGAMYVGAPGATGQMTDRRNPDQLPEAVGVAGLSPVSKPERFQPPVVLLALGLCLAGGMLLPACAANKMPAGVVTPAGQSAYRADQVIARLSEISDVVIGDTGDFPGGIAPRDAFTIIEWISGDAHANPPTTGIAQIVAASGGGQGWKATAFQSWNSRIRPLLLKYANLAGWVGIIDSLLGVM